MTSDSLIDDGLPTREPQGGSVQSDCKGAFPRQNGHRVLRFGLRVPDGTLTRCVPLVCPGQEFDGLEDTCDGVGLGDTCGAECAHGVAETYPCVWNDSTSLKINNPPHTCSSECRLASFPPGKCQSRLRRSRFAGRMHCQLRRELRGQVECNSIDRSDMPL